MSFNKIKKKHKIFKNTAYHLHTDSIIYKKKLECTNRRECNKTLGNHNVHLAFLTLLIREIEMFRW